jgi:CRISPR-associated protein Cas5t
MAGLTALKIRSSALTASFRYPRVQIGKLPTFDMPPPATIYGLLASVMGEWFEPLDLKFSYVFEHSGKAVDLEVAQPIERGSGKSTLAKRGWPHPVNVQFTANIQKREFLLHPKLTLYLLSEDLNFLETFRSAFAAPYFSYLIGRSQDLATCLSSEMVELGMAREAFFAHTLLPFDWRPWVSPGTTVLLPAAIDYERKRAAIHERYLQVTKPVLRVSQNTDDILDRTQLPDEFAVDPGDHREFGGTLLARGLYFWPVRGPRVSG